MSESKRQLLERSPAQWHIQARHTKCTCGPLCGYQRDWLYPYFSDGQNKELELETWQELPTMWNKEHYKNTLEKQWHWSRQNRKESKRIWNRREFTTKPSTTSCNVARGCLNYQLYPHDIFYLKFSNNPKIYLHLLHSSNHCPTFSVFKIKYYV